MRFTRREALIGSIFALFRGDVPAPPCDEPPPPDDRFEPEPDEVAWWHEQTRRP